ncbi:MAG: transporter [Eubacteriales Family XIII. Incertae Sedis bacterium]|nr:MAG: transporter [Clostridiales Family XIII bacterium]
MKTKYLAEAAVIAAIYALLTIVLAPISYGAVQVRISEALTVLPFFTPAAVPGLFVGCIAANIMSPYGLADLIFGSAASLIGAIGSYLLRKKPLLVPLAPVISNGIIVGAMLYYVYEVPLPLIVQMLYVALGEVVACYAIGYPLMKYLNKYKRIF